VTIDHIALRVRDLEAMRQFFERWFEARASARYENPAKGFSSYFLSFQAGARLELVHHRDQTESGLGGSHLAFGLGSREEVNRRAEEFQRAGFRVLDGPRQTGDGYWEAVVEDPEGNRIELTA
jgi:lactoylglutathione lyase